jgi:soluble lytic murein transglycosylase-like protein
MSVAALGGSEPIAATGASAREQIAATAAERVQQLQALIAQVERGPTAGTFASALSTAQAEADPSLAPEPSSTGAGASSTYAPLIDSAAARYGLNPAVLAGLIQQESGFDPSARSSAGALGLTQLMPSTAASLGVSEPLDPAQSIEGGARYLAQLLHQFAGNTTDALAAYNAGPGAVEQYGGVPPYSETQQYVANVLNNAASYQQSGLATGSTTGPATTAQAIA